MKVLLFLILNYFSFCEALKIPSQYSNTPINEKNMEELSQFHIKSLKEFHSIWLKSVNNEKYAIAYQLKKNIKISDKTLNEIEPIIIKNNLLEYYSKRLKVNFSQDKSSTSTYGFMWREMPSFDDQKKMYSINFAITKNEKIYWEYMKLIFLHDEAYSILEWDQPYNSENEKSYKELKENITTNDNFHYDKSKRSVLPQHKKTLYEAVLPTFSKNILIKVQNEDKSFFEKNRKSIGALTLILSMIFFVFFIPNKS